VNPSAPTKQREQKKEEQKKEYDDVVAQDLENFGMTKSAVTVLIKRYPVTYIKEKLIMAQGLVTAGSALVSQNPVGWLRHAIEDDYRPPQPAESPHQHSGTGKKGVKVVRAAPKKQHVPKKEEPKPTPNVPTEKLEPEKLNRETEELWKQTLEKIQADLPPGDGALQLRGTTLLQVTETAARIRVPNAYAVAWLERRLYGQIANAMKRVSGRIWTYNSSQPHCDGVFSRLALSESNLPLEFRLAQALWVPPIGGQARQNPTARLHQRGATWGKSACFPFP
jgi:hypothetical protein